MILQCVYPYFLIFIFVVLLLILCYSLLRVRYMFVVLFDRCFGFSRRILMQHLYIRDNLNQERLSGIF
jgi:hypothetical protein